MVDVSIIVLCHKQESTIRRTLDSILNQVTDYSYEIIIGDDCSPDGTRAICEEYVEKYPDIVSLNEEHPNYGVVRNYVECLSRVKGRYIMECAGDDWWHNASKINLQVDYMEAHEECVLCYGGANLYYPQTGMLGYSRPYKFNGDIFKTLLRLNPIIAPTVCIRTSCIMTIDYDELAQCGILVEDYPTWLSLSTMGTFHPIEDALVTYSIQYGSLNNTKDYEYKCKTLKNVSQFKLFICNKYHLGSHYKELISDVLYSDLSAASIKYNKRKEAVKYLKLIKKKDYKIILKIVICSMPFMFDSLVKKYNKRICY